MPSKNFKHWVSIKDFKRCKPCEEMHGKIYLISEKPSKTPPLHYNCRCRIDLMATIQKGYATSKLKQGADYWLKTQGTLPGYYVTKKDAKTHGWIQKKGNLDKVLPGMMIGGDIYNNRNRHLPHVNNRVWYEADINYTSGRRNSERVLYSSDGLIFVTYDHYKTFHEIVS